MSTPPHIQQLDQQHQALVKELLNTEPMIRGSFGLAYRKCGKPSCWCAEGTGHPVKRITWTEQTRSRTQAIPADEVAWVEAMTDNYKRFRKNRQALRALERKLNAALDDFEAKTVAKTKRRKEYLS